MLTKLTKGMRWRAAVTLVLLYALCVLAPAAAFALGDAARASHCLTADHHRGADTHAHADAAGSHDHASHGAHDHAPADEADGSSADLKCCGLMCVPALAATTFDLSVSPPAVSRVQLPAARLAGRGPDLLSRPPDSSLSV